MLPTDQIIAEAVEKWANAHPTHIEERKERKIKLRYKLTFILICALVTILAAGYSLTIGDYPIGFIESYDILFKHLINGSDGTIEDHIIVDLRLPQILTAIAVGMGLAVAGAVMQGVLRNPLADPYTVGLSSGAGFGATIAIVCGMSTTAGRYGLVLNAFLFSLIPLGFIFFMSRVRRTTPTMLIMAGLAVMYIFDAMSTLLRLWAHPMELAAIFRWQVGSLGSATWPDIALILSIVIIGTIVISFMSGKLNVIVTGDENAQSLGVDADTLRLLSLLVIALMTASVVSFTGLIGFVGLVSPHIVRLFIGYDYHTLIPGSAVFGMGLVVIADLIGRTIISPVVIQVGVIMAFMGGPLLIWLILKRGGSVL